MADRAMSYILEIPPVVAVAMRVISGEYGNGQDRIDALKRDGYDPEVIQNCVNELISLFQWYEGK